MIKKNNPKELWKFINFVIPNKRPDLSIRELIVEGKAFEDPVNISE